MGKTALKFPFLLLTLISIAIPCFSSDPIRFFTRSEKKSPIARTRIMIAPVISFYKINKNHSSGARQKMSGVFCIKEEFRLNHQHTMFFSIGAEYFVHGVNFFSYYFKPDSLQLYNGEMNYSYDLYIHELDIPLQLKISFKRENNSLVTPYVMFGYHLRTLLFGMVKVKENGEQIVKKQEDLVFKNPLIGKHNNPFVSLTVGIQKNNPNTTKTCIFAEASFKFGFSPYLLKDTFTPSSLYLNGNHLSIGAGMKF